MIKASVIMSVYNTKEAYLRECIESILSQSERDFEFIIIDDCCNEKTINVLNSYDDDRIILIHNDVNKGLTYNLNAALDISRGKYIVRMDADDVSSVDRIAKMIQHMEDNTYINILGSYMDVDGYIMKYHGNIPWEIRKALLLFENAGVGHPSVVFRKSFLDNHNIRYDNSIRKSQDYELWTRCIEYTNLYVYTECLIRYRIHDDQISKRNSSEQNNFVKMIKERQLSKFRPYLEENEIVEFSKDDRCSNLNIIDYRKIVKKILRANKKKGIVQQEILWYVLRKKYAEYLNYHYLNLYRIEKYFVVPLNRKIKKYSNIIIQEDDNFSYLPK